jgi:hypothetical protein
VLAHGSRQPWSWLILNVGQKKTLMGEHHGFSEPEKLWGGTFSGVVQGRSVILNVKFGLTSHGCALFNGGWDFLNFVGMIDGKERELKILKRGWFRTTLVLTMKGEPLLLKTSNEFGDMLRPFYGSEAYEPSE